MPEPGPTATPAPQPNDLQNRFNTFAKYLDTKGVYAGTGHRRIVIPKNKLSEPELGQLGFEPVMLAIPEAGQDRFRSFRHPDNTYHIHSHGDNWTMHQDSHPAATMLARTQGAAKALVNGIPHVVTEGIPGLAYYVGGQLKGRKSTADVVKSELSPDYASLLNQMPDAPTAPQGPSLLPKEAAIVAARLKKRQRGWHFEQEPGFHDVKGKFQDAAKQPNEVKMAAFREVLAQYGLDKCGEDAVEAVTSILRDHDFGFNLPPGKGGSGGRNHGDISSWTSPTGWGGGGAAERIQGFTNGNGSYGGV